MSNTKRNLRAACSLLLAVAAFPAAAQNEYPLEWIEKPTLHTIPDSLKKSPAVYVLEERCWEMKEVKKDHEMYRTRHYIIHLNDEKGVNAFNTFNIPIGGDRVLLDLKARSILKDGRVINIGKEKIKEVKNEDGVPEYLLAMEGIEPGVEVELLYTEQRAASTFGSETFQMGIPSMESRLKLIVPENLRFDSKGYNGFPAFRDSLAAGKHFYTASLKNISAIENESYSRYLSNVQRIDYKLSYVGAEDNVRKLTWNDLARRMHSSFLEFTDKELKTAGKVLVAAGIEDGATSLEKVHAIEDFMKKTIIMSGGLDDEKANDFNRILEKKVATEGGFLRLFTAALTAAGVSYEVGMVANRYTFPLDEQLEYWDHLDDYVLYLPKERSYLAPTAVAYRHPVMPYSLAGSTGVFTKTTRLGTMVSATPDIREIPRSTMEDNRSSVTAEVSFPAGSLTPAVEIKHAYYGNSASGLRPAFVYIDKDKEKEVVQQIIGISDKADEMSSYKIENAAFSNYTAGRPLELIASFAQTPKLMEKAGPKYLFRIGELIGRQAELYQEEKRVLPIEIEFPHTLPRTLHVRIPDGYRVSNADVLRKKVLSKDPADQERYGFVSDYKLDGQNLTVTISEFYKDLSYPLAEYESFRSVINAAADFNKVVLVFEKI